MSAITADYRDKDGNGYYVEVVTDAALHTAYRWVWVEDEYEPEPGNRWFDSLAEALRDAAWDWEHNGSDVPRRATVLKAAATRAEKRGL